MPKLVFAALAAALLPAASPGWDPQPWLADLAEIRAAVDRAYPNRDWLEQEREVALDPWFARTAEAIRQSGGDAGAREALNGLVRRFQDGHVRLDWPAPEPAAPAGDAPAPPAPPPTVAGFCAARGYDARQVTPGTAAALPGYRALAVPGPFGAGLVTTPAATIGVIRIGVFGPHGYPSLCEAAMARTGVAPDRPCDAACEDRVLTEAYALMTHGLIATVERLRDAGAALLLIDVTRNGGGSEWAEAAARIVSPVPLRSAPVQVLRSEAWVRRWRDVAARLRTEAKRAPRADRPLLADFAARADRLAEGLAPCPGQSCSRLAPAGFATGLVPEMAAGALAGRPWAAEVFSVAQYPYRDAVWQGPLIVLVDDETWSAAEQFTAVLRDNDAALVMGTRTGGAGCGHLWGMEPIVLTHSRAVLELPNCARLRRDGRNEVGGIVPDVPTGARWNDGPGFAGRLTGARLADAIAAARALRGPAPAGR